MDRSAAAWYLTAAAGHRVSAATVGHSDPLWRYREIRRALDLITLARRARIYQLCERAAVLTDSDFDTIINRNDC